MEENKFPEFNWGNDEPRLRRAARVMLNFMVRMVEAPFGRTKGKPEDDNVVELFDPKRNGHRTYDRPHKPK